MTDSELLVEGRPVVLPSPPVFDAGRVKHPSRPDVAAGAHRLGDGNALRMKEATMQHERSRTGAASTILALLLVLGACDDQPLGPADERADLPELRADVRPGESVIVIEDLGPVLGATNSVANAINNANQITGWRSTANAKQAAYVWSQGTNPIGLGTLGQWPYTSVGYDINDAGHVAGTAGNHAFYWSAPGPMQQLDPIEGSIGEAAFALNNFHKAVGWASFGSGTSPDPVRWSWASGSGHFLGLTWTYDPSELVRDGTANDVNDKFEVVGTASLGRAFYWYYNYTTNLIYTELAQLSGATASEATAINESGVIAGWSNFQGSPQAVRWPSHSALPQQLGTLGGSWSRATDINDAGVIVGASLTAAGAKRAFRVEPSGYLEQLSVPYGAIASEPHGINNTGHIVGEANFPDGAVHAVVWWHYTGPYVLKAVADFPAAIVVYPGPAVITLTIRSTRDVDASRIDPSTLMLGDGIGEDARVLNDRGALAVEWRDVDGDGVLDLVASFDGDHLVRNELPPRGSQADLILRGATLDRSRGVFASGVVTIQR
jgi:probable HAF family extracellular repeat protein